MVGVAPFRTMSRLPTVRVWRTATAERIHKPLTNVGDIVAVAISPDRERVASASTKGLAQVWRVADERVVALFGGLGKGLTDVAFSPNGRLLVTAGDDGTVRIAVIDKNTRRADLRGHAGSVASAAFSADGRSVVSAGSDGTVRVWDARPVAALAARGSLDRLVGLATRRLAATGRELTAAERQRYLG